MRGNRVKEKLNKGEVAIAVGGHSNTSDTIDFLGPLGFDGIWLEGEHGSVSWGESAISPGPATCGGWLRWPACTRTIPE